MKIQLTFKTPDVVDTALQEVAENFGCGCDCEGACIDCQRIDDNRREEVENVKAVFDRFIKHDEYITVEFDTDAGTCIVVGASKLHRG